VIRINRKVFSVAGIAIFALIVYLIAWSSLFTVSKVVVIGTEQISIQRLSGVSIGEKLARVEPRAVGTKLQAELWIQSVKLSRNWINGTVTIEVTPRIPIGVFAGQFIDENGTIFDIPGGSPQSLPVVEASSTELGLLAIELFTQIPQTFRSKVIIIKAKNQDSFELNLQEGSRKLNLIWGRNSDLNLKIKVYEALVVLKENSKISTIDVSAPHAPIVK
jgi:cell division septal protein FtsQ